MMDDNTELTLVFNEAVRVDDNSQDDLPLIKAAINSLIDSNINVKDDDFIRAYLSLVRLERKLNALR